MENNNNHKNRPARIGDRFHDEMNRIKTERIKKGTSTEKVSIEKLTNVIIRNKLWKQIANDIINIKEEELKELWD